MMNVDTSVTVSARRNGISLALWIAAMATAKVDAHFVEKEVEECGLWLGPSPIKEAEEHGWGHSIFTGKHIKKGTWVLGSGKLDDEKQKMVHGDLYVPVYDWESIDMATYAAEDDLMFDDDNEKSRLKEREKYNKEIEESAKLEPPLFHQLWNGDVYPEQTLESEHGMRVFVPGLSTISPCTWEGFNLEQRVNVTYRDWRDMNGIGHDDSPPSPQAGSFSYLSNAMFRATRDIKPGEELIVECTDNSDDFNPAKYGPVKFTPKEAGGFSICLDDKVEERLADHTPNIAAGSVGGQRGLFAKRALQKDEILTSTPMIPVHKEEMNMDREKYAQLLEDSEVNENLKKIGLGLPPQKQQLLMNYMYGHPESSLLWLASAPLLHAVNHAPYDNEKVQPNAKIQWHKTDVYPNTIDGKPLSRRQQFHHADLLEMDSREIVIKHGMGLMMDLVALRNIGQDEEILIDYGKAWDDAWKQHTKNWEASVVATTEAHTAEKLEWKQQRKREREEMEREKKLGSHRIIHKHHHKHIENSMTALPLSSYVTAADYNRLHEFDELRVVGEQARNSYPSNIETACYFEFDWLDDKINNDEEADEVSFSSWYDMNEDERHNCLLPCMVTERREYSPMEEHGEHYLFDDDDEFQDDLPEVVENGGSATSKRYMVKLFDNHEENTSIPFDCHIFKRFEYYILDVPREGITFVNKMHSTDQWIDQAFRQPIGLPEDMVPAAWKDLTRRKGTRGGTRVKKKPPKKEMTEEEEEEEREYVFSTKRFNDAESRRELLDDLKGKMHLSPRADL